MTPATSAPSRSDAPSTRSRPLRRRLLRTAAVVAGASLVLSACSDADPKDQTTVDPKASPTASGDPTTAPGLDGIDAALLPFYEQTVDWSDCGQGFECADIEVPLDWDDPAKDTITIAAKRKPAEGTSLGTILVNPGGPGGSGVEFIDYAPYIFGDPILENYDVLGFDPRGVGGSSPVSCLDDAERDAWNAMSYGDDEAALTQAREDAKAYGQACLENTGEVLGEIDTQSAARDMDVIRQVVGDEKLNYLGYSYGTQLGATYAGLYPQTVGRMVLDGAIDLRLSSHEMNLQQAVGFENALRAYAEDCLAGDDCPLTGTTDEALAQIKAMLDGVEVNPMPTDDADRPLTYAFAAVGIAQPLYSKMLWPSLTDALADALQNGDGSGLLALADQYNSRNADGTFADNSGEAFRAIGCLDDRGDADLATMETEAAEILAAAPTMGDFFTFGGIACADWPFPEAEKTFDLAAAGAPPIVVIGTTNDPATPYVWAEGLADQLDSGSLLTYEGEGHTAYGTSNSCIADAVEDFFVDGTVPEEGLVC